MDKKVKKKVKEVPIVPKDKYVGLSETEIAREKAFEERCRR